MIKIVLEAEEQTNNWCQIPRICARATAEIPRPESTQIDSSLFLLSRGEPLPLPGKEAAWPLGQEEPGAGQGLPPGGVRHAAWPGSTGQAWLGGGAGWRQAPGRLGAGGARRGLGRAGPRP